jgi:hypothetical protein
MRSLALIACVALGIAATANASDPKDEDKIVCKRQQDADTGSHFAATKKVCMKKSEWKEVEDQAERTMDKIRNGGAAGPLRGSPGGGPH